MIESVKYAKSKKSHKNAENYLRLRRLDVMAVGETEIDCSSQRQYNKILRKKHEIFQILHGTHLKSRAWW